MSFRRVTAYACIALATGWGFFPTSAHACGLFNWLWGDNTNTSYYAPVTAYMPGACNTCAPVAAQRPVVTWMPVTNYATTVQSVPVTTYRPSLFGGLFGCNYTAHQANRAPVTAWMPGTLTQTCPTQTCPTACQMPSMPVETVFTQPAACCPTTTMMPPTTSCCPSTTSYSPPVTTYSIPSSSSCGCSSSAPTTSYSVPATTSYSVPGTTTYSVPSSSGCSCGGGSACSCGSHASMGAAVGTGVLAGSATSYPTSSYPTSNYSSGSQSFSGGSAIVADTPPALGSNDAPRIDGSSLGLPETSYTTGDSSLSLSAPAVRGDMTVTPGPIRAESNVQFGVPTVRPLDSSSLPSNVHSAAMQPATDAAAFGVAPMRDPETRDRDGRLLAPPLLDPRAKTAELPQATFRNAVALDNRIPVMPASLTVDTPAAFAPASFSAPAPKIETTGLRPIDDAPVAYSAAKVAVEYPTSNASFAPAPASTGSNATQLSESLWQSARP